MRPFNRSLFAAVLTPTGCHVLEYRRRSRHMEVVRYRHQTGGHPDIRSAAIALADLLEAEGARDSRLALAVTGFGSCHNLLTLPPADPELLTPIVHREMRRFYPDLFQGGEGSPHIAFVQAAGPASESPGMRDLLAAAVPRELIDMVRTATATRAIELAHLTVVPAAMNRLFESLIDGPETAALALVTADYATVGFFHEGGLRLFTEPPTYGRDGTSTPARVIADQIARGSLYLRQQFRGAQLDTVYLSAEPDEAARVEAHLTEGEGARVRTLGQGEAPGALLALGAALDSHDDRGLNLLPEEFRPPSITERWTRVAGVAAAAFLLVAVGFWALRGIRAEAEGVELVRTYQENLVPRKAALARISPVVRERQAHATRAEVLRRIIAEREHIPELLWPLQNASPVVRIDQFTLNRAEEGWMGVLNGTARSSTGSGAASAVDALYREFSLQLPEGSVSLDGLTSTEAAADEQNSGNVEVSFTMSFVVPLEEWETE